MSQNTPKQYETTLYDSLSHKKTIFYATSRGNNLIAGPANFNTKITYYNNGNPKIEVNKINGVDFEKRYYEDGTLSREEKEDGRTLLEYHKNGTLMRKATGDGGFAAKKFEEYAEDGTTVTKRGTLDRKGEASTYTAYENGQRTEELNDKGILTIYYSNGKPEVRLNYEDTDTYINYNESGNATSLCYAPHCAEIEFHPNGQIKSKGIYAMSERMGLPRRDGYKLRYIYNTSGKLTSVEENGSTRKPNSADNAQSEKFLDEVLALYRTKAGSAYMMHEERFLQSTQSVLGNQTSKSSTTPASKTAEERF